MRTISPRLAFALSGVFLLLPCVHAQAPDADAVAACEQAAQQSLASRGAPPAELKFNGPPASQPSRANDGQLVLRGGGSWRSASGMRRFEYSCNVDPSAPETVGLVLRDTSPAATLARAAPAALEPDLRHLSPGACEASVAAALQKRWPRVSEIRLDSGARSLRQTSPDKVELHGQGRALPLQGSPYTLFGFDCEIDPRDGRVLNTRVSG
ncbi:MAG: hypothetical protein ABI671_12610 [Burkholderiales bacterium]